MEILSFHFLKLFFKYSCLHFPSTTPLNPSHPYLPPVILPPLALTTCPLYIFLDDPSPHYSSPPSSLVTVSLFFISMSLVIFFNSSVRKNYSFSYIYGFIYLSMDSSWICIFPYRFLSSTIIDYFVV